MINEWAGKDKEMYYKYEYINWPRPSDFVGIKSTTEPEVQQLLFTLVLGHRKQPKTILELGGFQGGTSVWLACALELSGGGKLMVVENETEPPASCHIIQETLTNNRSHFPTIDIDVHPRDVFDFLADLPDASIDITFLDDWHETDHVKRELDMLLPKMIPGGIIIGHDTTHFSGLNQLFTTYGIALNFGIQGIGIIQIPTEV